MKKHLVRGAAIAAAATLALAGCTAGGNDNNDNNNNSTDPIQIRIASPVPDSNQGGASLLWWAEQMEERTDGKVQVEVFPGGSFLPGTEILPGVGDGLVEAGLTFSVYHPAELPLYNLAGLPFTTNDGTAVTAAFSELYETDERFRGQFDDMNVKVLFFAPDGASPIGLTEKLDDFEGLRGQRLRVTGYVANALQTVGADSTFVEFAELYEALQRGTVTGWAGSGYPATVGLGLPEVTPYYHQPGLGIFSNIAVVINQDLYDGLPDDVRAVMDELAAEYPAWIAENLMVIEADACDAIIDAGGEAVVWSDDVVTDFKAAVGDVVETQLREESVTAGFSESDFDSVKDAYLGLVQQNEGATGYEDGLTLCAAR